MIHLYSSVSKSISKIGNGRLIKSLDRSTMHGIMDLNGRYYIWGINWFTSKLLSCALDILQWIINEILFGKTIGKVVFYGKMQM